MANQKNIQEYKKLLDNLIAEIDAREFISADPIGIPHRFSLKQDIEIAAFFASILAWGRRDTIIKNTNGILRLMDDDPFSFIRNHKESDLKPFEKVVHRTFNGTDCLYFIYSLRNIYTKYNSLEEAFVGDTIYKKLVHFKQLFFSWEIVSNRTKKHIADPSKNSSAKRLNMFLKWMVRKDNTGIDLGVWNSIDSSILLCPLDVHVMRASIELGLLNRNKADWKAVEQLSANLSYLDPKDPIKYDLALFEYGKSLV